jgi:hypothetical protein
VSVRGVSSFRAGLCLLAALVAPRAASAQQGREIPVQAGVTIEHDTVTVGDVVRLVVRVRAPRGATINFPAAVDSLGPVQSLEPPSIRDGTDTATASDRIATYRLAAWDIGRQPVKLGDVLVQTDNGERRIALTLPSLFVRSVLPADTALRIPKPARALLEPPVPWPWWYWAIAAAVVALGLLIWWLVRRRRRALTAPGDPYAMAQTSFDRVERLRLIEAGEAGRHASLMTDVLRRYIAARVEGASLAQTSGELLQSVRSTPTLTYDALQELLETMETVKFAAAPITTARAQALGETAKQLVREEHERAAALAAAQAKTEARAA